MPSSPLSISRPVSSSEPAGAVSAGSCPLPSSAHCESSVPAWEWVCSTAPAPQVSTIARCRAVSALALPLPAITPPFWSTWISSSGRTRPLCTPLGAINSTSGSWLATQLKLPPVPSHQPRRWISAMASVRPSARPGGSSEVRPGLRPSAATSGEAEATAAAGIDSIISHRSGIGGTSDCCVRPAGRGGWWCRTPGRARRPGGTPRRRCRSCRWCR